MTTSSLRRQVKNMVNNFTEAEIKVREATSNDPWGPPSSLMSEISDLTFNVVAFTEVMGMIWKRLNDSGKNWRHVYKALTLLDYLIKTGSERVPLQCRENIYTIQTLRDFQHVDRDGRDQGVNVREKAKQLALLLRDEERLKVERAQALKTKERMAGSSVMMRCVSMPPAYRVVQPPGVAAVYRDEFSRSRRSPSSYHTPPPSSSVLWPSASASPPPLAPDMEQARPHTSGEEELQLQLALAMSREESEKPELPPPAAAASSLDMDEDTQLQLALSLSKEEHQQEQQSRQGDESLLQKALEESKREQSSSGGGSALMDLVDVFAVAPDVRPTDPVWERSAGNHRSQPAGLATSDPWDSLADARSTPPGMGTPWTPPPAYTMPSQPWERSQSPSNPWDTPGPVSTNHPMMFPAHTDSSSLDPFSILPVEPTGGPASMKAPARSWSPSDGDLFDEAMDGGQVNGRGDGCAELFDLSGLGESLAAPSPRACHTPEAFLGPTAASLVNLDTLIPSNPPAKNKNPFLSGLTDPSPNNPFQSDPPLLSLHQMRPSSTSPVPPAAGLPYSASLTLPSLLTQPSDMPGVLPQPLLPLSCSPTPGLQADEYGQNPFL